MKRNFLLLTATFGLLAIAPASAATVSCTVNQTTTALTATTAGTTVSCGGVSALQVAQSGLGSYISSITLIVRGAFSDSQIDPVYNGQVEFAFTEQSSEFVISTITGLAPQGSATGDIGSTGNLTGFNAGLHLSSLSGFDVTVLETLIAGGRLPTSSQVTVAYSYTVSAPEPSAWMLLGSGLTAAAAFRLRRRSRPHC